MLRLINIEKTEETIKAEYIPEDSEEIGKVELSQKNKDIIMSKKTSLDEITGVYLRHAVNALGDILNEPNIPKTRLVMWH